MLKVVDIHLSPTVQGEYVVLQNQGLTTISLQGWVLTTEDYTSPDPASRGNAMYVFSDDVQVRPYARVVLFTCHGTNGWYPTTDGKPTYVVFWNRSERVWSNAARLVLLQPVCNRRIGMTSEVTHANAS